jgi:hypothetical protein
VGPITKDPLAAARDAIGPALPRGRFHIFVFGPSLRTDEVVDPPTVPADHHGWLAANAKFLRWKTAKHLLDNGYSVHFGETREVYSLWDTAIRRIDLANLEINHAKMICGAIIIYPASPGALCELGLFAGLEEIAKKTLAIVHLSHQSDQSFFRLGLLEILKQEYGTTEYEDYAQPDACVRRALTFADGRYLKMLRDLDLVRRGDIKRRELPVGILHK